VRSAELSLKLPLAAAAAHMLQLLPPNLLPSSPGPSGEQALALQEKDSLSIQNVEKLLYQGLHSCVQVYMQQLAAAGTCMEKDDSTDTGYKYPGNDEYFVTEEDVVSQDPFVQPGTPFRVVGTNECVSYIRRKKVSLDKCWDKPQSKVQTGRLVEVRHIASGRVLTMHSSWLVAFTTRQPWQGEQAVISAKPLKKRKLPAGSGNSTEMGNLAGDAQESKAASFRSFIGRPCVCGAPDRITRKRKSGEKQIFGFWTAVFDPSSPEGAGPSTVFVPQKKLLTIDGPCPGADKTPWQIRQLAKGSWDGSGSPLLKDPMDFEHLLQSGQLQEMRPRMECPWEVIPVRLGLDKTFDHQDSGHDIESKPLTIGALVDVESRGIGLIHRLLRQDRLEVELLPQSSQTMLIQIKCRRNRVKRLDYRTVVREAKCSICGLDSDPVTLLLCRGFGLSCLNAAHRKCVYGNRRLIPKTLVCRCCARWRGVDKTD